MSIQITNNSVGYGRMPLFQKGYRGNNRDFLDRIEAEKHDSEENVRGNGISIYDAYAIMQKPNLMFNKNNTVSNLKDVLNGEVHPIDNAKYSISLDAEGRWEIYNKELDISMCFRPQDASIQIDEKTGKAYIISDISHPTKMDVMFADEELLGYLKQFLNTDQLPTVPLDSRCTIEIDSYTGIERMRFEGEYDTDLIITNRKQLEKLQELADLYRRDYPNLVSEELALRYYAVGEVKGHAFRTENGIITIAINAIGYDDENNPEKDWSIFYRPETGFYEELSKAILQGIIAGADLEKFSEWEKFFEERMINYEVHVQDTKRSEEEEIGGQDRFPVSF